MTTTGAISNANSARSATDTNQKLNYIAQAISELARAVAVIKQDVKRIKGQTSA
jgi:outer membrane murein-binding lipoprotein Lpp